MDQSPFSRSGVTLVELLVVISIVVLLAAFTIPSVQPAMESRRIRQAARSVRAYVGAAQGRALEKNRSVGVLFERDETDPRACRVLRQVEIPPPYAGDFEDSMIKLTYNPAWPPNQNALEFTGTENPVNPSIGTPLVQSGDVLQLNYLGHRWEMTFVDPTTGPPWRVSFYSQSTGLPPANLQSGGAITAPFRILRQPFPSAAAPLVLPRGTVIDLDDSGYQNGLSTVMAGGAPGAVDVFAALDLDRSDPTLGKDVRPVMIMFSPGGGVDRVYRSEYGGSSLAQLNYFRTTRSIFLMIGRWDRAGEASMLPEDGLHNWEDAENLWLALNSRTGQVTVAEMSTYWDHDNDPNTPLRDNYDPATNRSRPKTVFDSRRYAREAQISRGGR